MSWLKRLSDTYDEASVLSQQRSFEIALLPIAHTNQTAHIKIVIDISGNFVRAEVLDKIQINLPATEKSASRSSGLAPHPLSDKLLYVAEDYAHYKGAKKSGFELYKSLLKEWTDLKDVQIK